MINCFAIFLLIGVVACWLMAMAVSKLARRSRRGQTYAALARQFSGQYLPGGLWTHPSMRFRYGETWATVSDGKSLGPFSSRCFQVRIHWPHAAMNCELFSRVPTKSIRTYTRLWPTIQVDADLSLEFEVIGQDSDEVRQLLTSGVRWQIDRLVRVGPTPQLHVLIRNGTILVQKPWPKLRGELPAQFIQGALEFYDQCMLAKAVGIQFLHNDMAQPLEHVICKICGEEIEEQMVICRRCKTPHHMECWEYAGSCSIFGCREKNYFVPPVGHPVTPPAHAADRQAPIDPEIADR